MKSLVLQADYHRNGVSGEGFYVGIVADDEGDKLLIHFPEYDKGGELARFQSRIAVLDLAQAAEGNIYMHPVGDQPGGNAWRGDHYVHHAEAVRDAVEHRWANQ